jgi:zinc protease
MIETRLGNGLTSIWAPDREQPGMVIAFQIPYGKFCDPNGKEGIADLAVALIQKGPKGIASEQFAEKLEFTGASLFSEVGDEHIIIGAQFLTRFTDVILPLFWDLVCNPSLDEKEFGLLKKEMITATQAEVIDPGIMVRKHFYAALFGIGHPAGRSHTVSSLKRLSIDDIRAFYRERFFPDGAYLVSAGDIDTEKMRNVWEPRFSAWKAQGNSKVIIPPVNKNLEKSVVRVIDNPDLSQTSVALGHFMPGEVDEDRETIAIANYILGGGNFSSRLMAKVRSDKGKTYGIASQLSCNRDIGAFMITTSTQNNQVRDVLATIFSAYRQFSEKGASQDELTKAKQYAVGSMAFQLEGIGNITEKLLWLRLFGRKNEYIETFDQRIAAITSDELNRIIKHHLSETRFIISAVGKKDEILRHFGEYGSVKVYNFRDDP